MEEGGARGKVGTGAGSRRGGRRGAGAGLRVDDGPNRDMVLGSWAVGADVGAGVGTSG